MKRIVFWIWMAGLCVMASWRSFADPVQTLDLKPFLKPKSPIEKIGAGWLVPHGLQVMDGIPFQIDGAILFYASNWTQRGKIAKGSDLINVPVSAHFEKLHLLAASDIDGTNDVAIAKVHLEYTDGSEKELDLVYGEHLRCWQAPWHKPEAPVKYPESRVVWSAQHDRAAQLDKYLRLFHVALSNPSPDKEVRALKIESAHTQVGLLLLAVSVGPAQAEHLPDTVSAPHSPFPDLRPRHGEPVRGEGIIKGKNGQPLASARIRISAVRELKTEDRTSTTTDPVVGLATESDAKGHFVLPPLPDDKLYRLLVYADGYEPFTYPGLDPKSDPVEIRLNPMPGGSSHPQFALHGRVIGPDGKPVPFTALEYDAVEQHGGECWGCQPEGLPKESIANAGGEFAFGSQDQFSRLHVIFHAPDLAPTRLWLNVTNTMQTVQMTVGAKLHGRVLKDGKPLTNLVVKVVGEQRNNNGSPGAFETRTGTNGEFLLEHLPPNETWKLCGKMSSFRAYGALPPRTVKTAGDLETNDLGDLQVEAGLRLFGKVKTRYGESLPKGMKIQARYNDVRDEQTVVVDDAGHFAFDSLFARSVDISLLQDGWKLSNTNRSMNFWIRGTLSGLLEQDKNDLLLVVEKGKIDYDYWWNGNGQPVQADRPESHPLWGAEDSGPGYIVLAGQVVDDQTGQPIPKFKVVPGHKPPVASTGPAQKPLLQKFLSPFVRPTAVPWNERIFWQPSSAETYSNGTFAVPFVPLTSQPVLRIEASGYQQLETDPIGVTTTNLVFRLQKGAGPNGVVLMPNGSPAKGATVIYGINQEQFSLEGTQFDDYGEGKKARWMTKQDGKFSFDERAHGMTLYAAHAAGWAQQSVQKGGNNLTLKLKPWAWVAGTLVDSNNVPMAGVRLGIDMLADSLHDGVMVNIQNETVTDAQGRFLFTNVPPERIEVNRMFKMSGGWLTSQTQTWLYAKPGITNDVGKVTLDRPPPLPALDRLKQNLGL